MSTEKISTTRCIRRLLTVYAMRGQAKNEPDRFSIKDALKALLLKGVVDNRREIEELHTRLAYGSPRKSSAAEDL